MREQCEHHRRRPQDASSSASATRRLAKLQSGIMGNRADSSVSRRKTVSWSPKLPYDPNLAELEISEIAHPIYNQDMDWLDYHESTKPRLDSVSFRLRNAASGKMPSHFQHYCAVSLLLFGEAVLDFHVPISEISMGWLGLSRERAARELPQQPSFQLICTSHSQQEVELFY